MIRRRKWLFGIVIALISVSSALFASSYIFYRITIAKCYDKSDVHRSDKACSILNEALRRKGLKDLENDLPDTALGNLNDAIEYDPKDYQSYGYRAYAYWMTGDYAKAAEDFKNALAYSNLITCKCAAAALAAYQADIQKNLQKVQAKLDHTDLQKSN